MLEAHRPAERSGAADARAPDPPVATPGGVGSEIAWNGASTAMAGVGDAGLLIFVIGGVVIALRFAVRALARTFWGPVRD